MQMLVDRRVFESLSLEVISTTAVWGRDLLAFIFCGCGSQRNRWHIAIETNSNMDTNTFINIGLIKTLYINFRCCKIKDAVHLLIFVARNVGVAYCKRNVFEFPDGSKTGMFTVGFNRRCSTGYPSALKVQGKIILHGTGIHAFGAGCDISVGRNCILEIGDHFGCTGETKISVSAKITIGKNNLWSYGCTIMDYDGHKIFDGESGLQINKPKEVVFGDNIWMGNGCTILKGSVIPSGCIIAARSLISKPLSEENSIITSQGKTLKSNIRWKA